MNLFGTNHSVNVMLLGFSSFKLILLKKKNPLKVCELFLEGILHLVPLNALEMIHNSGLQSSLISIFLFPWLEYHVLSGRSFKKEDILRNEGKKVIIT